MPFTDLTLSVRFSRLTTEQVTTLIEKADHLGIKLDVLFKSGGNHSTVTADLSGKKVDVSLEQLAELRAAAGPEEQRATSIIY